MFKSVSPKHVTFLFTHNAYINIHTLYFTKYCHHGFILIIFPLQTWKINCTSSSLALMDKVIVPESLCKTIWILSH